MDTERIIQLVFQITDENYSRNFWNMTDLKDREQESQWNIQAFPGKRGRLTTQQTVKSFFHMKTSWSLLWSLDELTPQEFPA